MVAATGRQVEDEVVDRGGSPERRSGPNSFELTP